MHLEELGFLARKHFRYRIVLTEETRRHADIAAKPLLVTGNQLGARLFRMLSIRVLFTAKSLMPSRDAERTCITCALTSNANSTSSTKPMAGDLNSA